MHAFEQLNIPTRHVGLHWFGQASFALKDPEGSIFLFDPYFPHDRPSDAFVYPEPPLRESELRIDHVVYTHDHSDHTHPETAARIHQAHPRATFLGPPESVRRLIDAEIPQDLVAEITAGESATLNGIIVNAVWAKPPAGDPDSGIDIPDVQHIGYVVEAAGVRVYLSGDPINNFAEHEALLKPITDLQPDIGILTTHPTEGEFPFFSGSVETALQLALPAVVPAHYDCFTKRTFNPADWADLFPEEGPEPLIIPYNEAIVFPG